MWFEQTVDSFQGFNVSQLGIDEAWLNFSSSFISPVWIYTVSNDCHKCPFQRLSNDSIVPNHTFKAILNVQHGLRFRFRISGNAALASVENDSKRICDIEGSNLGEFGVYSIALKEGSHRESVACSLNTDLEPVNIYFPIVAIFAFWLLVGFLWRLLSSNWYRLHHVFNIIFDKLKSQNSQTHEERQTILPTTPYDDDKACSSDQNMIPENPDGSGSGDEFERRVEHAQVLEKPQKENRTKTRRLRKRSARNASKKENVNELSEKKYTKIIQNPTVNVSSCDQPTCSSTSLLLNEIQSEQHLLPPKSVKKERLKSLDAFRGICILIMIFVDDGGGGYYFFRHCTWDGLYVADLVFPWFLWICGVCIPFSIHGKMNAHTQSSKWSIIKGCFIRSVKLVVLGIMVNTSTRSTAVQLENLRIPGVLQRFGICYFIGSSLFLLFSAAKLISRTGVVQSPFHWKRTMEDIKVTSIPWLIVIICTVLHLSLTFFLPVPNCPIGYLGPAGLHDNNTYSSECVGGAAGYLDRLIFGLGHIHNRPTAQKVYGSGAFDPEGSLGILMSILHLWLGVQAGIIFITYKTMKERIFRFLFWSLACGVAGLAICGGYLNHGWIPVNKNLWSLSFVLVTSSAAFLLLSLLYYVIDVRKTWSGSPLLEAGMNSILLYLGHEVCHAMLPWHYSLGRMRTHSSRLMESCWGTVLWIIIAVNLYNRQLFFVV